ncbi:MAG: transglycosylase domain-containing protein, partial [Streptococcus mitis]|nr:transglycosylase domain-containing protein [Streptococcus mitis]
MKLDKLFEKFLSLFKKETSKLEDFDSTSLRRSRSDRKKLAQVGPIRKFWRRYHLTKIVLILGLSAGLLVGTYLFAVAKSTNVNDLQNALKTRTIIFDREEKEAGALSGQKGTYVELTDISKNLQNAVIATEDRSFYKNDGINYGRFFLAIVTAGRSGGGSTITQQLAKNAYLSQDQTVERKAKEFFLALELTKKYSKDQILTMYLNNAYFGNGVWGVEDASKKYFGVSASEVSLDQAATLAGMLKGPELYNPLKSVEDSTNRRDTVLQNMVAAGYIDKNQETEAAGVDMTSRLQDKYEGKISDYRYPSYFDAVVNEAVSKYNLTEEEIVNN